MKLRALTYQTQSFLAILMVLGLFAMLLHPVTHVITDHAVDHDHDHTEVPTPVNHSDDCIECVLTAASALDLSESIFFVQLTAPSNLLRSDFEPEVDRLIVGFSLRGPPFGLYMT